LLEMQAQKLNV